MSGEVLLFVSCAAVAGLVFLLTLWAVRNQDRNKPGW